MKDGSERKLDWTKKKKKKSSGDDVDLHSVKGQGREIRNGQGETVSLTMSLFIQHGAIQQSKDHQKSHASDRNQSLIQGCLV